MFFGFDHCDVAFPAAQNGFAPSNVELSVEVNFNILLA
jgi:hypothetical protein